MVRVILGTVLLLLAVTSGSSASAKCCLSKYPKPSISYHGDRQLRDPIQVTVCHGYWDRLAHPRWWNPTIRYAYTGWEADLEAQSTECHDYEVKPGTDMRLFAECVNRVIGTGPMWKSKKYYME